MRAFGRWWRSSMRSGIVHAGAAERVGMTGSRLRLPTECPTSSALSNFPNSSPRSARQRRTTSSGHPGRSPDLPGRVGRSAVRPTCAATRCAHPGVAVRQAHAHSRRTAPAGCPAAPSASFSSDSLAVPPASIQRVPTWSRAGSRSMHTCRARCSRAGSLATRDHLGHLHLRHGLRHLVRLTGRAARVTCPAALTHQLVMVGLRVLGHPLQRARVVTR